MNYKSENKKLKDALEQENNHKKVWRWTVKGHQLGGILRLKKVRKLAPDVELVDVINVNGDFSVMFMFKDSRQIVTDNLKKLSNLQKDYSELLDLEGTYVSLL